MIWNFTEFKVDCTLEGHKEAVNSIIVLSDGRVISASTDQLIKVREPPDFVREIKEA